MAECFGKCGAEHPGDHNFWCPQCKKAFKQYLGPRVRKFTAPEPIKPRELGNVKFAEKLQAGFQLLLQGGDR